MAGHWGTFVRDAGAALTVLRRFPVLPLVAVVGSLSGLVFRTGWMALISAALGIFYVGWVGTERVFYLRGFRDLPITAREAFRLTRAFFGRYLALAFFALIPYIGVLILVSIAVALWVDDPGVRRVIAFAVPLLLVDVLLTFATPALAFTTSRASQAVGIGWRMLKAGWPGTAWYALLPPMAVLAVTYTRSPEDVDYSPSWILATCGAALLNLVAKGATAAFYLRQHETDIDGAAFKDRSTADDPTRRDVAQPFSQRA